MSGGPVMGFSYAIGKSRLIGVNVGHIESRGVSGGVISHFVRADAIGGIVKSIEA